MEKVILLKSLKLKTRRGRMPHLAMLLLAMFCFTVAQAQSVIKGKVTDETGTGLPGVNVLIKNTTIGSVTDANGDYSISNPDDTDKTLVFSFIGYSSQEITTSGRTTIDIKLVPDATQLNEVVVVGYGTQQKRDVTGAIASISSETLQEVAAPNVVAQLKGRLAGVDIQSNSSTPGGGGAIRIRGNRSLATDQSTIDNLDQPLLVVDGIPYGGNINDISPNDIANLEVLKDASATAIYGSRGAGGVILITTKKGRPGKNIVNYDAYYGVSSILGKLNVMNGPEYAAFKQEAANAAAAYTPPQTSGYLLTAAEQAALTAGVSTNWQDLIYQKGYVSSHTLGVTGGTDKTSYSLSGSYFKEAGIIPNQDFTRYSIRGTIDNTVSDRIKIGLNTLNTLSYANTPGGSGVPGGLMRLTPLASPYNPDGTINLLPQAGQTDNAVVSPLTLLTKSDAILARSRVLRSFNSLYAEVKIVDGLRYRINVGLDFRQQQDDGYSGAQTYTNSNPAVSATQASVRNFEAYRYTVENLILYDKTIAEKHKIGFTGLYSFQKDHQQNSGFFGLGVPADYVQNYNIGLATQAYAINPTNPADNPNSFSERGLISYMGRVNYSFDGRYVATVTVRTDGSSILSPGNQYFTYPAFSVAWNIQNEKFMQSLSVVNTLKLRAGWGVTGNQGIAPYSTLGALSTSAYNFGAGAAGQQLGYTVTTLPNNSLKWQSTSQMNIGLDFGLFQNRLTGAIEYYQQETKDIILNVLLPPSNGANSTTQNLGKTKGHGLEISLSSVNIKSASGVTWTTDLNYFFNREEIVQLTTPDEKENKANGWFVGQPITVIYDYKKLGIWQTNDAAALAAQTSPVQKPGQIRVEDYNKDGRITTDDRQIIGNFQPTWEGGMTNKVTYKRFDLSVQIYARMGMKVLVPYVTTDGSSQGYTFFMQSRNNQLKVDYWTPTNPTNAFPQPDATTDRAQFSSTLGYVDGSFVRVRSINLGYDFPSGLLSKVGIQSLRLYVSAINPFMLYSPFVDQGYGPDPEGNGYGGAILPQGVATGAGQSTPTRQISVNANNPSTKQFLVGLNLKF